MKLFKKDERSGFRYWFAHWCAFNMTAMICRHWKFKYLFHDIEKPWLKLILRDYKKVQQIHRKHNKHHLEYLYKHGPNCRFDFEAMMIDWECSRFTKASSPRTAKEELESKIDRLPENLRNYIVFNSTLALNKLGLN